MPHASPLIATLVGAIVLAFVFGAVAVRLKLPPLVGYLIAGVLIGPFTPGFVADQKIANEFAEIGVILLMFGVGLHFSMKDLLAVRAIAIPGALVQIGVAVVLGMGLAHLLGWGMGAGFLFGLSLSVASTVVLIKAMQTHHLLDTERGRIAVGWLIVEDLVMVLALVLIPALAHGMNGSTQIGGVLMMTGVKVAAFIAFMLVVGRRIIPWVLHAIAHTGSRELFRLAVLAIALGVAFGAAALFGVSFALGAFFAGMILAESALSQRAAEETLPLRDAFAVLFFVSVGMLFNPSVLVESPLALIATVLIIVLGKSLAAFAIVRMSGRDRKTAVTIAASLAQIGEFSFILAALGVQLKILPSEARDLVLAGAIFSILANPFVFVLVQRWSGKRTEQPPVSAGSRGEVVLVGHGRVGSMVARSLLAAGQTLTIVETEHDVLDLPTDQRVTILHGNAADPETLAQCSLSTARLLIVAIPQPFEAGQIVEQARAVNPKIRILTRAHSEDEVRYFERLGADLTIVGEREIARRMIEEARR